MTRGNPFLDDVLPVTRHNLKFGISQITINSLSYNQESVLIVYKKRLVVFITYFM